MKKVYCISGMGCDHRIFRRLQVAGYQFVPVPWLTYNDDDTLVSYAARMAATLPHDEELVLLGLSFGGMLATEIAKLRNVKQLILVSSAKVSDELPNPGPAGRYIVKQRLIPPFCFAIPNRLLMGLRGIVPFNERTSEHTAINGRFMQWALQVVLDWRNTGYPANTAHIHGSLDIVIPLRNVKATHVVKGGPHVMVYSRAQEVSAIIDNILNN